MKSLKDLLKRTPSTAAPESKNEVPKEETSGEKGVFTRFVTDPVKSAAGTLAGLPGKIFKRGEKKAEAVAVAAEKPETEKEDLVDFDKIKDKLTDIVESAKKNRTAKTVLIVAGAGVALAGMAADMAFFGGAGTLLVGSCLYGDLRNAQHIKKLSSELEKIDGKIEGLISTQSPMPDYQPALTIVKGRIEEFQKAAQKLPPEIAQELQHLKEQVEGLQKKIGPVAPANDDGTQTPQASQPKAQKPANG